MIIFLLVNFDPIYVQLGKGYGNIFKFYRLP